MNRKRGAAQGREGKEGAKEKTEGLEKKTTSESQNFEEKTNRNGSAIFAQRATRGACVGKGNFDGGKRGGKKADNKRDSRKTGPALSDKAKRRPHRQEWKKRKILQKQ